MTDAARDPVVGRTTASSDGGAEDAASVPTFNLANNLTILRLLLVPVFGVLLLVQDGESAWARVLATVVFVAATLTDRWDGQIARRRGLVTDLGKVLDPIADKALIGTAFVGLAVLDELAWAVAVVILVREVGVTALRFWVIRHGVIPASRGGKVKAVLQAVAIVLYLLPLTGLLATGRTVVMAAAVVVTILTGLDYVVRALKLRREAAERGAAGAGGAGG